jgi:hypothetical protein
MGYRRGLPGGAASARAAGNPMQVLRGPMGSAPAVPRAHERLTWQREGGPGPGHSPQAMLVVAHSQQRAKQDGRRDPDKPDSKENQPEGHALPVIAYRELNNMRHQLQGAVLVSSRTVRRNPARPSARTLRRRACQGRNGNSKFTRRDWTDREFWVSSIPRASRTPCSRPREVRDVAPPLTSWKGDPASTKRRCPRRFGDSRDCLISPGPAQPSPVRQPTHCP